MILVVGLAVAGLAGIAAAFYFSIRNGDKRDRRSGAAGSGRARADRLPPSRGGVPRPDRSRANGGRANGGRAVNAGRAGGRPGDNYRAEGDSGPDSAMDFSDPVLVGGRRGAGEATGPRSAAGGRIGDRPAGRSADRRATGPQATGPQATGPRAARPRQQQDATVPAPAFAAGRADDTPGDPWPADPQATDPRLGTAGPGERKPGSRSAARMAREAETAGGTTKETKTRRRVGFRKGADVDEEMWPLEGFGGVSDEQFWDEMASDKPLTTTARTAQQDSGPRTPTPDARAAARAQDDVQAHAQDSDRNDRNATQSAYAATQPVQSLKPQTQHGKTQHGKARPGPAAPATPLTPVASAPATPLTPVAHAPAHATPLTPVASGATRPVNAVDKPSETRRRRHASPEPKDDPLTSAAYALRSSGPVDGRSFQNRPREAAREAYEATTTTPVRSGRPDAGPANPYGSTPPHPYPTKPYSDPPAAVQANANTPPYGENYGYGRPAAQADDSRPQHSTRRHARPGGYDEENRTPRQTYPQDGYQGNGYHAGNGHHSGQGYQGSNPQGGNPQGSTSQGSTSQGGGYPGSGYQGTGYQGNGHHAPYDPREDYRRLTPSVSPLAH